MNNEYCQVSRVWLENLARYAEEAKNELNKLDDGRARLIASPLIGYASSAETLIKYQKHD